MYDAAVYAYDDAINTLATACDYRARYYDPAIGRFLSEDEIGNDEDVDLYVYVGNRPVIFRDPTGFYKLKGFSPIDEQRMRDAIQAALNKLRQNCDGCAGADGPKIANAIEKATFIFQPDSKYCGQVGPFSFIGIRHSVGIGKTWGQTGRTPVSLFPIWNAPAKHRTTATTSTEALFDIFIPYGSAPSRRCPKCSSSHYPAGKRATGNSRQRRRSYHLS